MVFKTYKGETLEMIEKPYKFGFRYPRQKILQGELVYVAHPTENYCGWYQKLRKSSKIVGYFQIQGNEIGKFFRASTIEDSECWNAQTPVGSCINDFR